MATTEPIRPTLNFRIRPEDRDLIDRAAAARGTTRTEFILNATRIAAEEALLDRRVFVVDPDAYDAFLDRLEAPPDPNARLKRTLRAGKSGEKA